MYNNNRSYQNTDIATADRGKLILMIYDHCLKWSKVAIDAINRNDVPTRTKAIFKVQDGITELLCALDFERGGEIAKNLQRLYDFYNRHLSEANLKNSAKNVEEVQTMMSSLREAWVQCFDNVRKSGAVSMASQQQSMVSLVG